MHVLVALQENEDEAEQEGRREEDLERQALACEQRVVRDRHRDARGQQQCRIDQRQSEWRHRLELAADLTRATRGPGALVAFPEQQVREEVVARPSQPGDRHVSRIEQRAEERREEHHFREDEPEHALAERLVDLGVVEALLAFADDRGEPSRNHEDDDGKAQQHDVEAGVGAIQPARYADHQEQQADGSDHGPVAAVRDVIAVVSMCRHCRSLILLVLKRVAGRLRGGVKKRVLQRDGVDVVGQVRVDDELQW